METKEIKKLVHFARKAGIRAFSYGGVSFEFFPEAALKNRAVSLKSVHGSQEEEKTKEIPRDPTYEEIQEYINSTTEVSQ